ncbi:hypothetical protein [Blastopirellula marina]|uniref:Uncharacterized protein n=1 Tax=Blastopirellula marina TaxID=124 RepID=A0A2S8GQQ1_9BACT|nr:hypothetical protein [Blastopirellula marina]PQO46759.1 hypothetical protein C5Y93_07970 [Blastopirellula marina]
MNPAAVEMFSTFGVVVLCIVLGVITLAIFFNLLGRLENRAAKADTIAIRGVLKKSTWATVYMTGAETFERVRFVGFTNADSIKTQLPFELNGMVILEDEAGRKFIIRAKAIRMIVVEPDAK